MRVIQSFLIVSIIGLAGATTALGETFEFNFVLEGLQEDPPNNSNASGAASLFMYDTDTQTFDLDMFILGISLDELFNVGPNLTPVHIHMAPPGASGSIVVDLGLNDSFFEDGAGIRLQLSNFLLGGVQGGISSDPADNEVALFAGNLYINVHTDSFPDGHIRGQIVPEPATLVLIAIGGTLLIGRPRRRSARRVA